ncbi:MAG: toxin-antitoxin system YwqK family antitoxin [Bacteroidota bacterium]
MKYFLVIPLLLLFAFSQAQPGTMYDTAINKKDGKGRKQGVWKKFYKDGKMRYSGTFKDDKPIGEFLTYTSDGLLESKLNYFPGGTKAKVWLYHEDGRTVLAEGQYINKLRDSIWKFYTFDAHLISVGVYKKNKLNGVCKTYYPLSGKINEEISYTDSIKNGPWKQYYEAGNIKLESQYVNGKMEGLYKTYWDNKNLMIIGKYVNDYSEGRWVFYKADGKIEKVENYKKGKLIESIEEKDKKFKELEKLLNTKIPEEQIKNPFE